MVDYSISSSEDFLYLSVCDDPGKYKKSYNKLSYKQINVYLIFISIKKFHKANIKESHCCSFLPITLKIY